MKIGELIYNGKTASSVGAFVSGKGSFNAAAPDYTSYQIPGRNGDLIISNNRYKNIDVSYPAFIPADFEQRVQEIRNWMRSARSYARIYDNYDPEHFRLGIGKDILVFETGFENKGANAKLVFDCKPQRFLTSGEEAQAVGVWGPTQTASGDVVSFEDGENGAFKSITASITPTQAGGVPSPDNPLPITGRTEATVWRMGQNLLNYDVWRTVGTTRGISVFENNGVTLTATENDAYTRYNTTQSRIYVREGMTVTLSWEENTNKSGGVNIFPNGSTQGYVRVDNRDSKRLSYTVPGGVSFITFRFGVALAGETISYKNIQVTIGETVPPYTPYSGSAYPISWQAEAGTVYGGTVDVVSGVLTSTMKYIIVDGDSNIGKENTGWANNYEAFYINISANKGIQPPSTLDTPNALSNQLRVVGYQDLRRGDRPFDFSLTGGGSYIDWTSTSMTLEEEKARLAETPIYICYELVNPQTYQLTGQQIKTILGTNNVWADSGDVTAEWGEDPSGLYNPTPFDASPLIKVRNPQNGATVTVNGQTMTCSAAFTGEVTIDCDLMNVYSGNENLNQFWSGNFPKLLPGINPVAFANCAAVEIIPRWWEL